MLNLKDKAVHPTTKKPYIKSVSGGRDHSIEGLQVCSRSIQASISSLSWILLCISDLSFSANSASVQNGFTHVFVMEFENEQDRNFYVEQDEAHLAVVASLGALVDGSQVLDYTPGKF